MTDIIHNLLANDYAVLILTPLAWVGLVVGMESARVAWQWLRRRE